tara:strand:+ start:453 stop:983 length:531 start_codon:yes stop_codon:yes gene_type:complete
LDFINLNMINKTPAESKAILTEIVLPNDTNNLDNLMGGRLLYWMDITASITAQRHCNRTSVTASVNNVSFNQPIPRGSIVTIEGKISRSFNSSMEIFLDVWAEDSLSGEKTKCNEAIYTFVAVNNMGRPVKVPGVSAETELEKTRYDGALRRRQLALILSGKMKAADATELKALFS